MSVLHQSWKKRYHSDLTHLLVLVTHRLTHLLSVSSAPWTGRDKARTTDDGNIEGRESGHDAAGPPDAHDAALLRRPRPLPPQQLQRPRARARGRGLALRVLRLLHASPGRDAQQAGDAGHLLVVLRLPLQLDALPPVLEPDLDGADGDIELGREDVAAALQLQRSAKRANVGKRGRHHAHPAHMFSPYGQPPSSTTSLLLLPVPTTWGVFCSICNLPSPLQLLRAAHLTSSEDSSCNSRCRRSSKNGRVASSSVNVGNFLFELLLQISEEQLLSFAKTLVGQLRHHMTRSTNHARMGPDGAAPIGVLYNIVKHYEVFRGMTQTNPCKSCAS